MEFCRCPVYVLAAGCCTVLQGFGMPGGPQANYRAWVLSELGTQTIPYAMSEVRSVLSAGPHTSKQVRRNSLEPFTSSRQP